MEAVLEVFIIFGVIVGSIDIIKYFNMLLATPPVQSFSVLQTFLGHTLLLVIGLELVVMLVQHTPSSVIEVLLYAIARKIIVEAKTMFDIVLGILAIAGLFAINRISAKGNFFNEDKE